MTTPLVSFNHLSVSFAGERTRVRAVQEVSFTIQAGQTVGVVGESGCGKSVTAMALMGLLPPQAARIDGGEIRFADRDLLRLKARQMADLRGHQLAMIFQEPMSALNPVLTIGEQLCEPLIRHLGATPKAAWQQAIQLLSEVGLARGDSLMTRYPHQLSGGMLQRVMIAMALSCQPKLLIADEPTTALDVTVQAQILRLLRDRARASQMAMMLITHDLGVIAQMAEQVVVMYAGRIVEQGVGGCTLFPARCRIWPLCRRAAPLPGAASGRRRAVGRRFRRCSVSASGPPAFTANLRRRQHERTLCY
ncbi:peptide/nickel transport system ATP-binding protein [Klebsiella variicola]|nr:peptide/nickel transport system ATP-binding protein [Klebsiella variicola]